MWKKFWEKIKSILFGNDKTIENRNAKKIIYRFEIGDNLYYILWWFGLFTLIFFEKC